MSTATAPYVDVPFAGDPYRLLEPLQQRLGSLLFYRLPQRAGGRLLFACLDDVWRIRQDGLHRGAGRYRGSPADAIDALSASAAQDPVGWAPDLAFALSYDLTWQLRAAADVPPPASMVNISPDRLLGFVGPLTRQVVYDGRTLRCHPADHAALTDVVAATERGPNLPVGGTGVLTDVLEPIDRERYRGQVERAFDHLRRGDVYQIVISVPVRVRPRMTPYRYFAEISARYASADYCYWFSLDGVRVFGNCSLPHLTIDGDQLSTRVFAGTQPAALNERERSQRAERLRGDPKYYAEHMMLVDLERNDLNSCSQLPTVTVDRLLEPLVIGPTTYLTSDVSARATPGGTLGSMLLANFPRGVVTGAPKIRAQELIAELEGDTRGFYSGALGVYDGASDSVWSNTIVTCAAEDSPDLILRCGGGVVVGSEVEQELHELDLKLRYLL